MKERKSEGTARGGCGVVLKSRLVEEELPSFGGFAQTISVLQRLNALESAIATIICTSKVPVRETRKFLVCTTPEQASNVPLFQFMKALFAQIGITLGLHRVGQFEIGFMVSDCPIVSLCGGAVRGKVCHITREAISRFFMRDLELTCDVEEVVCQNEGGDRCEFTARLDPLEICLTIFDDSDALIVRRVLEEGLDLDLLSKEFQRDREELEYRVGMYRDYGLIDESNLVTDLGKEFLANPRRIDKGEKDPPWRDMSDVSSHISSALSFAEAMAEAAPVLRREEGLADSEIVKKAGACKSFAELLAKEGRKLGKEKEEV